MKMIGFLIFGAICTIISLVSMLQGLSSPSAIGPAMARSYLPMLLLTHNSANFIYIQ
jgi:hypothetical protein